LGSEELPDNPAVVRDLLAYFLHNRDARGTLQNLAEWRIRQEVTHRSVGEVDQALRWLEKSPQQLILREDNPAGPPVFRLDERKIDDAERLLARLSEASRTAEMLRPAAFPSGRLSGPSTSLMSIVAAWIDSTLWRYDHDHPVSSDDQLGIARDPRTIQRILRPVESRDAEGSGVAALAQDTRALMEAIQSADPVEPLATLYRSLTLTRVELQVFVLALASEIDTKYHAVFGMLNDDLGRRSITLGLACAILGEPSAVRQELERTGALTRWRLLDAGGALPHADEALRLDPPIVAWLFGDREALVRDTHVAQLVRQERWPGADWMRTSADADVIQGLRTRLASSVERWTVVAGDEKDGAYAAVEAAARCAGEALLRIVLSSSAPREAGEVGEVVSRLARICRLQDAVAVVDVDRFDAGALGPGGLASLLGALSRGPRHVLVIVSDVERVVGALPQSPGHCLRVELPRGAALAAAYETAVAQAGLHIADSDLERLAAVFPLPFDTVEKAIRLAALSAKQADLPWDRHFAALFEACRRVASPDLPRFGRRVDPVFALDDVVLPPEQRAQLEEIVANVRYAPHVMQRWGFAEQLPYGRGVAALFSGPSGTGKTMAAQAIASALDTDAYVVDLSRVVSKYIGETEKNLGAVFEDAERSGAVLVFDEADALFGKRSEIKDAHDRYANIEVAYLLQRMEAFSGLAVLTTNYRQNLDPAFVRRLRFIVDFRKPDEKAREAIWRRSLSTRAPVSQHVNLRFLAKRLDLTGGTIQQIAVRAAFAAAAEGAGRIEMQHVMAAARAELLKLGLTAAEGDLAGFEAAFRRAADVA
jgi:hypothetical protein